mmetsp:Transcript_323/g.770  ORF Transcript_323/g.770 Transcript_323/m.770 type:complete len:244 (+) Transcript_323:99-830(+)
MAWQGAASRRGLQGSSPALLWMAGCRASRRGQRKRELAPRLSRLRSLRVRVHAWRACKMPAQMRSCCWAAHQCSTSTGTAWLSTGIPPIAAHWTPCYRGKRTLASSMAATSSSSSARLCMYPTTLSVGSSTPHLPCCSISTLAASSCRRPSLGPRAPGNPAQESLVRWRPKREEGQRPRPKAQADLPHFRSTKPGPLYLSRTHGTRQAAGMEKQDCLVGKGLGWGRPMPMAPGWGRPMSMAPG